ncbi:MULTISPECIES: LytR/AlgR family response regulator transcription factor [Flavobacteriaceae]|uniref:LytR/AlgR family response regulator transcription factor n=1 Tax=Flavobacteriaceae TaxID=49546 RepID=UPI00149202D3|nr:MULTISPECIES: response regulator transcription factor [Allomuricauda]MDC6366689.1 response regulator transcription factor [Muricauda sp. AC10]
MKFSCIIVDDEFLARKRIVKLLENHKNILVLAECKNGKEAVEEIKLRTPDFIFLDIEMPDWDGFSVLKKLDKIPYVIFTTAYDNFALKAFEINAVDYLLKPFDQERMDLSLERMQDILQKEDAAKLSDKISTIIKAHNALEKGSQDFQFEIKKNGRVLTVPTEDIVSIHADGNYLVLKTVDQKFLYRSTMQKVDAELSNTSFVRVHRSIMVNKKFVDRVAYKGNSEYKILLKTKDFLMSGRSYKKNVISLLDDLDQ